MKNYYEILGIASTASKEEIKAAYKKLALKFHPDKNSGDKYFETMFKNIQEAYENLIDDEKRRTYEIIFHSFYNKKHNKLDEVIREQIPPITVKDKSKTNPLIYVLLVLLLVFAGTIWIILQNQNKLKEELAKAPTATITQDLPPPPPKSDPVEYASVTSENSNTYLEPEPVPEKKFSEKELKKIVKSAIKEHYSFYERDLTYKNIKLKRSDTYSYSGEVTYEVSLKECINQEPFKSDDFHYHARILEVTVSPDGTTKVN